MNKNILVKAENLGMKFKTGNMKYDTLKERMVNLFKKKETNLFTVLKNINFEIKNPNTNAIVPIIYSFIIFSS